MEETEPIEVDFQLEFKEVFHTTLNAVFLRSRGLFMVIINALLLELVAYLVKGFIVTGLWPAILGSLVISIITTILTAMTSTQIRTVRLDDPHERRPPRHIN